MKPKKGKRQTSTTNKGTQTDEVTWDGSDIQSSNTTDENHDTRRSRSTARFQSKSTTTKSKLKNARSPFNSVTTQTSKEDVLNTYGCPVLTPSNNKVEKEDEDTVSLGKKSKLKIKCNTHSETFSSQDAESPATKKTKIRVKSQPCLIPSSSHISNQTNKTNNQTALIASTNDSVNTTAHTKQMCVLPENGGKSNVQEENEEEVVLDTIIETTHDELNNKSTEEAVFILPDQLKTYKPKQTKQAIKKAEKPPEPESSSLTTDADKREATSTRVSTTEPKTQSNVQEKSANVQQPSEPSTSQNANDNKPRNNTEGNRSTSPPRENNKKSKKKGAKSSSGNIKAYQNKSQGEPTLPQLPAIVEESQVEDSKASYKDSEGDSQLKSSSPVSQIDDSKPSTSYTQKSDSKSRVVISQIGDSKPSTRGVQKCDSKTRVVISQTGDSKPSTSSTQKSDSKSRVVISQTGDSKPSTRGVQKCDSKTRVVISQTGDSKPSTSGTQKSDSKSRVVISQTGDSKPSTRGVQKCDSKTRVVISQTGDSKPSTSGAQKSDSKSHPVRYWIHLNHFLNCNSTCKEFKIFHKHFLQKGKITKHGIITITPGIYQTANYRDGLLTILCPKFLGCQVCMKLLHHLTGIDLSCECNSRSDLFIINNYLANVIESAPVKGKQFSVDLSYMKLLQKKLINNLNSVMKIYLKETVMKMIGQDKQENLDNTADTSEYYTPTQSPEVTEDELPVGNEMKRLTITTRLDHNYARPLKTAAAPKPNAPCCSHSNQNAKESSPKSTTESDHYETANEISDDEMYADLEKMFTLPKSKEADSETETLNNTQETTSNKSTVHERDGPNEKSGEVGGFRTSDKFNKLFISEIEDFLVNAFQDIPRTSESLDLLASALEKMTKHAEIVYSSLILLFGPYLQPDAHVAAVRRILQKSDIPTPRSFLVPDSAKDRNSEHSITCYMCKTEEKFILLSLNGIKVPFFCYLERPEGSYRIITEKVRSEEEIEHFRIPKICHCKNEITLEPEEISPNHYVFKSPFPFCVVSDDDLSSDDDLFSDDEGETDCASESDLCVKHADILDPNFVHDGTNDNCRIRCSWFPQYRNSQPVTTTVMRHLSDRRNALHPEEEWESAYSKRLNQIFAPTEKSKRKKLFSPLGKVGTAQE